MNNETRARLQALGLNPDNLSGARFSGARLIGADLSGADLSRANLSGANLSGANLSGADLRGARLIDAILSEAEISGANLSSANLFGAILSGADFSGAMGNGREVQSMLVADHRVVWWADGRETLVAIDCQTYPLSKWKTCGKSIAERHGRLSQWQTLGPVLLQLIEASPPPTTTGNTQ